MQKFQGKYRIDSTRAKWWNYANEGQYFITINSKDFKYIFGHIVNGEMILNEVGKIVAQCWNDLPKHYPNIILEEFCIMPNHVHFIVGIDNSVFMAPPAPVETGLRPVCSDEGNKNRNEYDDLNKNGDLIYVENNNLNKNSNKNNNAIQKINFLKAKNTNSVINPRLNPEMNIHGLNEFIKSLKSFSSRRINELNGVSGISSWHSRFHDVIIRDENSYKRIKQYIINNPKKWNEDCYYKKNKIL
jgi:putative transposase